MAVDIYKLARAAATKFIVGYDIFISYSRQDGQEYAHALYNELSSLSFAPYIDAVGTTPSDHTPEHVLRVLRRSSMMVVITTPGAAKSIAVAGELEAYSKTGRNISLIDIDASVDSAIWVNQVIGLPRHLESSVAFIKSRPSDKCLTVIRQAATFTTRSRKLRNNILLSLASAIMIVFAGLTVSTALISSAQQRANDLSYLGDARGELRTDPYHALCAIQQMSDKHADHGTISTAYNALIIPGSLSASRLHTGIVTYVAFSEDSEQLFTASNDGTAKLWNWRQNSVVSLEQHKTDIRLARWSPDNRWLLTMDTSGVGYLRRANGKPVLSDNLGGVAIAGEFTSDSEHLFIADPVAGVHIWSTQPPEKKYFVETSYRVTALALSPDNKFLIIGQSNGTFLKYAITFGAETATSPNELNSSSTGSAAKYVLFSHDGQHALLANQAGSVQILEAETGVIVYSNETKGKPVVAAHPGHSEFLISQGESKLMRLIKREDNLFIESIINLDRLTWLGDISTFKYVHDGNAVLLSSSSPDLAVLNLNNQGDIKRLRGHDSESMSLGGGSGTLVSSGSTDGEVRVWNLKQPFSNTTLQHDAWVTSALYAGTSEFVTGTINGQIKSWRVTPGSHTSVAVDGGNHQSQGWIRSISLHKSTDRIIATSDSGLLSIFQRDGLHNIGEVNPKSGRQIWAEINANETRLVTVGRNSPHHANLWQISTSELPVSLARLNHSSHVNKAVFGREGKYVYTIGDDGFTRIWSAASGKSEGKLSAKSPIYDVDVDKINSRLAAVTASGKVIVWDLENRSVNWMKNHGSGEMVSVAFSADGSRIISGGSDGQAKIWASEDGELINVLGGHPDQYVGVYGDLPNNLYVTTSGNDAFIWDQNYPEMGAIKLQAHEGPILTIAYNPDNSQLLTGSSDSTARIWPVASFNQVLETLDSATQYCHW